MRSSSSIFTLFVLIVFEVACFLPISDSDQTSSGINDFWKELRNMSKTDFINKYVNAQPDKEKDKASYSQREDIADIQLENIADIQQGNAPETPVVRSLDEPMVPCYPMNVSVKVPVDPNPIVRRVPPCVVLPRCGGCCEPESAIKCLPSATDTVPVTVYRGVFDGRMPPFSKETLSMEVHTACSCMCSIKPSDCNAETHNYNGSTCSCECKNEAQSANCGSLKTWNSSLCQCVCRHVDNCLENEVFDNKTCTCVDRVMELNQRASPAGLSMPSGQLCRPGFTPTTGGHGCRPSSSPSNPRRIQREFPFSRPDPRRRR